MLELELIHVQQKWPVQAEWKNSAQFKSFARYFMMSNNTNLRQVLGWYVGLLNFIRFVYV